MDGISFDDELVRRSIDCDYLRRMWEVSLVLLVLSACLIVYWSGFSLFLYHLSWVDLQVVGVIEKTVGHSLVYYALKLLVLLFAVMYCGPWHTVPIPRYSIPIMLRVIARQRGSVGSAQVDK